MCYLSNFVLPLQRHRLLQQQPKNQQQPQNPSSQRLVARAARGWEREKGWGPGPERVMSGVRRAASRHCAVHWGMGYSNPCPYLISISSK